VKSHIFNFKTTIGILPALILLPVLFISACTLKKENTVSLLEQTHIEIKDEKVDASLDKAMASYRQYLQQAPASKQAAEARHRLANLEVEKDYSITGIQSPALPGAKTAIQHYTRLLTEDPMYEGNDQVLYQLSRAYEDTGEKGKANASLQTLASRYPDFAHMDEVNFRLGEYFFLRKKYKPASQYYAAVLPFGEKNAYYPLTLNKLGWAYFKQDKYEPALNYFIASLDHLLAEAKQNGTSESLLNSKKLADGYHSISMSVSYLNGADAITTYFKKNGDKSYTTELYKQLAEYYLSKKRYSDAAGSYQAFINVYPFNEKAASYAKRIIEIYQQGSFTELSIKARKQFAINYDRRADYWRKNKLEDQPEINAFQKNNIHNLATHYHAAYKKTNKQKPKHKKQSHLSEATHWYKEFNYLYPLDKRSPKISKLLAELFLEQGDYRAAARAFERTANNFPDSDIAEQSAYAAIFAYREHLKNTTASQRNTVREDVVRSSLLFVETYPQHAQASAVLITAANDLLLLKNYNTAANTARRVIRHYPQAEKKQLRIAWRILADASFETRHYAEAEKAYQQTLSMTDSNEAQYATLIANLAAAVYKQGERAKKHGKHAIAAQHFLRINSITPTASLASSAQFDAASALIATENWSQAAIILEAFQQHNADPKLAEATKRNLAIIYKKNDKNLKAAIEFEKVVKNNNNKTIQRDALLQAADLYRQSNKHNDALRVYQQYVTLFPSPVEDAVISYQHIADIYKLKNDTGNYFDTLNKLVIAEEKVDKERTWQSRKLAANALLIIAEVRMHDFSKVTLNKPFKKNLALKQKRMNAALELFRRLLTYQISEVTTATTFYTAEIYLQFSQAMAKSERPTNLNELELEQYELALDEQVYVFEEKAIDVHNKNTELLGAGIYDPWVNKSIQRLSELWPARYAKREQTSDYMQSLFAKSAESVGSVR
jgi:tetratricopeptide (TPR) repeat protein